MGYAREGRILQLFCLLSYLAGGLASTWSEWWTYEGISGPDFWGLVNPEWSLCTKGKRQSPINIDPQHLLFDPSLNHIHMDKHKMSGTLMNTGHDVRLTLDEPSQHYINISGGPFTYQYRVSEIILHFGNRNDRGSEHTLKHNAFPAEIQILGYNTDIYGNMTQAVYSSYGIAVVALLATIGSQPNPTFDMIAQNLKQVRYKGEQVRIRHLSVSSLLPETTDYMTYEGSLTQPGCFETATWVIMNRPIYITQENLMIMRELMQGNEDNPKVSMLNNCRPTMPLNNRPVRTNINFVSSLGCTMEKQMYYQVHMPGAHYNYTTAYASPVTNSPTLNSTGLVKVQRYQKPESGSQAPMFSTQANLGLLIFLCWGVLALAA